MRPSAQPRSPSRARATAQAEAPEGVQTDAPATDPEATEADAWRWEAWRIEPGEDRGDGWFYATCPRCQGRSVGGKAPTLLGHLATGYFFCVECGHHGDATMVPSEFRGAKVELQHPWWESIDAREAKAWLGDAYAGDLPADLEVGFSYALVSDADEPRWEECLVFPCRDQGSDAIASAILLPKDADGHLGTPRDLPGTSPVPLGWDRLEGDTIVFVDHPLDRLALEEAGFRNAVCVLPRMNPLLPGGGDWSALSLMEKTLNTMSRFVMALRDDETGKKTEEELARRIGRDRCMRVRWQAYKTGRAANGAEAVLAELGADALREAVQKAPAYPVAGIHELHDVDESFENLYEFGLQPGVSTGWPTLDLYYTVKLGQWTVLTGIPGHGKSNFVDALAINLAKMYGWRFGMFSPESQPIERHYASLMEKSTGLPFNEGRHQRISVEEKDREKLWLNDHFKSILPDEDEGTWTVDGILALARTLVLRHGIRGLVIDPWNELNHTRPSHVTEADYIAMELTKVRRFARTYGVHVWVVVHPNKQEKGADGKYSIITPYMLAGGANWRNKADNILSGFRNLLQVDEEIFDLYIQKIRFKEVGRLGRASLRGDPVCGRYIDDIDHAKREAALRAPTPVPTAQQQGQERKVRTEGGMPIQTRSDPLPSYLL